MENALIGAGIWGGAAAKAVVDGLAALEAGFDGVPVFDGGFATLPAEEDDFVFYAAGEVEEAGVEVFDLDADFVDFGDGFTGALDVLLHGVSLGGDFGDVDRHTASEVNAARNGGEFGVDRFGGLLALNSALQERLDHGKHGLSFV
jgi:hypothetical protein